MPAKEPIIVTEKFASRQKSKGRGASTVVTYVIDGTNDEDDAEDALIAAAPTTRASRILDEVRVAQNPEDEWLWEGTCTYRPPGLIPFPSTVRKSFSTTGGTVHINTSRHTTAYGTGAPDYQGAIGVTEDMTVEGTDVIAPTLQYSVERLVVAGDVTNAFVQTLYQLTGTINNATFGPFAAGEALFLGASGQDRGDGYWQITYDFAGSANASNIPVGSLTVTSKRGWDYLWVHVETTEVSGKAVPRPKYAYVEKVYPESNFAALGITF